MKRDWTSKFWHAATQCFLGGMGIGLVTFVCFRLGLNATTTGFAYLILIVLAAQKGTFIGSAVLSIVAVGCLIYFFTQPLFDFRVDYPDDILALAAFLTTSIIVTGLTAKVRKMAVEAQASQEALVDTIPALVWSARPDGSRDFHSQRWLEFSGLSAAEATGEGWAAVFHPEERATVVDRWRVAVATGEPFEVEARGRNVKGEYRWFLVRAEPLRDESGAIVKWYGSSTDIEDRKRATEALRASEEQWREVFEHNPVMYFMVDATGTVLSVNAFGAAQLGYTVGELVGQSVLQVFLEEDREAVQKNVAVCLEKLGQSHSWEIRKVRKDGTLLWVRENAKAVRRADDQLIVLVACEDITERTRTEDALRLSEACMAHAQQVAGVGSWAYKSSHKNGYWDTVEHWSAETWRIADFDPSEGYPPTEVIFSRIHPEDRQRVVEANTQVLSDRRAMNIQYRYFRADGELRVLHSVGTLVHENGVATRFVGATMDITEQEQSTEALRRSEEYLAEAQKLSHTGSFGWRVASGEIIWSEETFRIFECDRAMTPTLDLVVQRTHPEDRAVVRQFLERVSQDGGDWVFEHRLLMPAGSVKHLRAVAYAVKDASGELEFVGAVMDITVTRRAEEELHQARTELARVARVTALGELTAAIAHEVNQPLTGLVSSGNACLRWLGGETPNLEAARRAIERMINDGSRASEVVSRIRALVRKSPPRRDWLNMNDAITEVIALIRTEVQRNRISLETELSNDLPLVVGDRIQLQQVILNLVMNAIEAMSGINPPQRKLLVASVKDGSDGVLVEVRDSGAGLDQTALDRLFEAFYTTKPEGMGMGLAISRTIVEAHGGELTAKPNAPQGAIFRFRLPTDGEEGSPA